MRLITILAIKFIICTLAFAIGLDLFFDASASDIISFSLFITIISYVVSDRMILPRLGNINTAVIDFLLVYMAVWIFGDILFESYLQLAWGSIVTASLFAGAELAIHRYLIRETMNDTGGQQQTGFNRNLAYGMEMAEEQDPRDKK
ncbi:YndM family protein [Bacillus sp. T33-2]|uniref:YndM family protein n=1 Tax=Bacillus sp. T33-2 TaxID=2054168 RepID=UPI000C76DB4B|nr:YndM family protein [Bacillus sp. T33-2]PLR97526.1 hypothetical protein CVD19_08565 [Bacillus sp. T33-2]